MAYTDFSQEMFRGDDRTWDIAVTDGDTGAAKNITGWSLWLTAKAALSDADGAAVFQRSTAAGGITISNAAGGLATATIPASATTALTADTDLFVDIQGKDGAGKVATLSSGKLKVLLDVTQTST